ncbi:ABC transporter ATP-binding protein [Mesoplasma syrphidae]|uniref:ABC transporter ATP-binding protein n=1 Tax=Mesoplasma syrphidae TaxID=225999 RepID=A0A2K9BRA1_9MOLU|nr:ABC transporter ATP-binding protein [Mesoplasma syrphidae]AUF83532.1 ABC transporter ATP-binding protein [Mesoplasma syrphidae]
MIELKGVSKTFKTGFGIKDISFTIKKGEIVGFLGDNGAGKTTIIKLIFNEYAKDSGVVLINNRQNTKRRSLRKIAFFPDQNNFPLHYKIKDFMIYSAKLKKISKENIKKNGKILFEALNLVEYENSRFNELSAGLQKRALLLSILITDPEIIVLDEPTANLDVKSRIDFLDLLQKLAKFYNKTIFITSHNIDELNLIVNKIIIIEQGKIIYENKFDYKKEDLRSVYSKVIGKKISTIDYCKMNNIFKNNKDKEELYEKD